MNMLLCRLAVTLLLLSAFSGCRDGEISLFDGKTLNGWKSNDEVAGCFAVEDGKIKVSGGRAHLFYVGADGKATFTNFVFKAKAMTTPGSNSGIYFHTEFQQKGWPEKGYECQVNTSHKDPKKTGGLYAIRDVMNIAPSKDNEWFDYTIVVKDKHVVLQINGKTTAEFSEPADWQPPKNMSGRRIGQGTFCLQGHDPKSTCFFKDIRLKPLP